MPSWLKLLWEVLKSAPQLVGLVNELIKLIRKIAGNDEPTKPQIDALSKKLRAQQLKM